MGLAELQAQIQNVMIGQIITGSASDMARAMGPHSWPGRGRAIRTFEDFISALRRVEARVPSKQELATRLRLAAKPKLFDELFKPNADWMAAPDFYWKDGKNELDSVSWEIVAGTGYIDIDSNDGNAPRERVAVWPIWFGLGQPSDQVARSVWRGYNDYGPDAIQGSAIDLVTWLGVIQNAWRSWNRWRTVDYHAGRPLADWTINETGPLDGQRVKNAIARSAPLEDLLGCIDAVSIQKYLASDAGTPASISDTIQSYYGRVDLLGGYHYMQRSKLFLASTTLLPLLDPLSPAFADEVRAHARKYARWGLRTFARIQGWRASEEQTPWGSAAIDFISDKFATLLTDTTATISSIPTAGFGVKEFKPAGIPVPLYGGWDLQFEDDDVQRRFGGKIQTSDLGGHIAALVGDLRSLAFTAPDVSITKFDARVAMAVREFQIEASQRYIWVEAGGIRSRAINPRRYFGRIHGIVDGETRRVLQIWLHHPEIDGEQPTYHDTVVNPQNALRIVACDSPISANPTASTIVNMDVWGPMGVPTAAHVDIFDYQVTNRRHWAFDFLKRMGEPIAAERPNVAAFAAPFVLTDSDVLPLGRINSDNLLQGSIGGPNTTSSDHWTSTRLTLANFLRYPSRDFPLREADWRIVYCNTFPETLGYSDVLNAWDRAMLSFGWCHWTLLIGQEMGGLLSWYRSREPLSFHIDFGKWGVSSMDWPTREERPGKYVAPVLMFGTRPFGQVMGHIPLAPMGSDNYLNHTWMRSWRSIYRVAQALRLSEGTHRAFRDFAVRRIWQLLNSSLEFTVNFSMRPTLGQICTSEKSVVALLRWHINAPNKIFSTPGLHNYLLDAVIDADQSYRNADPTIGVDPINPANLANPGSPGAVSFQNRLVEKLVEGTHVKGEIVGGVPAIQDGPHHFVRALSATNVSLPDGSNLRGAPGSYPGPLPAGSYP